MTEKKSTSYPKEKIKILFLENISSAAVKRFTESGYAMVEQVSGALSENELIEKIKDVHILGIRSKTKITSKVIAHAPKLQSIGCFCIGTNQVDLAAATQNGIAVFNSPYSNTRSVAELVIASAIMLIRKIPDKNQMAHEGKWLKDSKGSHELRGKVLGIVGYGNIGSQVSVLGEALGLKILFYDTETKMPLGNAVAARSLKELIKSSDIVTLHVPDLPSTRNMITKEVLKTFQKHAILINYARGEVVDLEALKKSLLKNELGGAAIDVFPVEPEKNGDDFQCPLQKVNNVILTPHVGGSTEEAQHNIGEDVSIKLFNFLEKGISTGSLSIPALNLPIQEDAHRILHIHKNVPGVLSEINSQLSGLKINIVGQYLKTNENIGYVVLDIEKKLSQNAAELLKKVKGTIKVRLLY